MSTHPKRDKRKTARKNDPEESNQETAAEQVPGGDGHAVKIDPSKKLTPAEESLWTLPEGEVDYGITGSPGPLEDPASDPESPGGNLFEKFDLEELLEIDSATALKGPGSPHQESPREPPPPLIKENEALSAAQELNEQRESHGKSDIVGEEKRGIEKEPTDIRALERVETDGVAWPVDGPGMSHEPGPAVIEELPPELLEERIEVPLPVSYESAENVTEKREPLILVDEFWGNPEPGEPEINKRLTPHSEALEERVKSAPQEVVHHTPPAGEGYNTHEVEETYMINNINAGEEATFAKGRGEEVATAGTDELQPNPLALEKPQLIIDAEEYLVHLWESNQDIYTILTGARTIDNAREELYSHIDRLDRQILTEDIDLHSLEKVKIREALDVLRQIISPLNEARTGVSALDCLWKLANDRQDDLEWEITVGFILEFVHLFRAISGNAYMYKEGQLRKDDRADYLNLKGRDAAVRRAETYEDLAESIRKHFKKFPSGLEDDVIAWRKANVKRMLKYFKAGKKEWNDHAWQMRHIIRDLTVLYDLVELSEEQKEAVRLATELKLPVAITPYYISLMDRMLSIGLDHSIRARLIPTLDYIRKMAAAKEWEFEGRHLSEPETAPIDRVILRHPMTLAILPFAKTSQSILYCQRNWEIEECLVPDARALGEEIDAIMEWLEENPGIDEILITGQDLMMLEDKEIGDLLGRLSDFRNVHRICIDTRTPVTLPMRWTDELLDILEPFNASGSRLLTLLTHFEHPYEITPDSCAAVQKIRTRGIEIFNQHILSIENSRRFEINKLRHDLRLIGVVPLYGFSGTGDDASRLYMVPLARILQEQKEEAALMPGFTRTDRALSHLPVLGRNSIDGWKEHSIIMIRPQGSRVYELHAQQSAAEPLDPYYFNDIPIYDYLQEIASRGENPRDYKNIWFYY
jgi:lysine 2,3-aminomutase